MGLRSNWERDPQFGNIVPGAFTPVLAKYLEVVGAPAYLSGAERLYPCTLSVRMWARSGPEVGFEEILCSPPSPV
jgi:hypothetical protein